MSTTANGLLKKSFADVPGATAKGGAVTKAGMPNFSSLATVAAKALPPAGGSTVWGLVVDLTASREDSRNRLIGDKSLQGSTVERLFRLTGSLVTTYFRGNNGPRVQKFDRKPGNDDASAIKRFLSAACESGGTEIAASLREVMGHKQGETMNVLMILDTADGAGDSYEKIIDAIGKNARLFIVHDVYGDSGAQSYSALFQRLCETTGGEYIPCDQALTALDKILAEAETAMRMPVGGHPMRPPSSRLAQALVASRSGQQRLLAPPVRRVLAPGQG